MDLLHLCGICFGTDTVLASVPLLCQGSKFLFSVSLRILDKQIKTSYFCMTFQTVPMNEAFVVVLSFFSLRALTIIRTLTL